MFSTIIPIERYKQRREILRLIGSAPKRRAQRENSSFNFIFITHRLNSERRGYSFSCIGRILDPPRVLANDKFLKERSESDVLYGKNKRGSAYDPGLKVVLLKGRYKNSAAVTLKKSYGGQRSGYGAWCHKVLVADTTIFWVKQADIYLLDYDNTLPFGVPVLPSLNARQNRY